MSLSKCCISGSAHTGTPVGREDTIGGLDVYVSEPSDKSTRRSIVFLTDIFGWKFVNVRLLADNYAKAGFTAYIPDVHSGDSLDSSLLQSIEPPLKTKEEQSMFDKGKDTVDVMATLGPWLVSHREAVSEPIISGFINTVRQIPGTDKVGALGFCWGGRYAVLQAQFPRKEGNVGGVDAAVACHPSLLSVPGDFEGVGKPLSLAVGDKDSMMDQATNEKVRELLAGMSVESEVVIYEDQIHG